VLKKLSPAEKVSILLDQYAAAIKDAFLQTIRDIRASIILRMFVNRVEARDYAGALEALNLEPAMFNPVLDEVAKAYSGGGNSTISSLPPINDPDGFRINLLFDARNPTAELWLRTYSARLVADIVEDQKRSVRDAITKGIASGLSALAIAQWILGRRGADGIRTGGIIGLTFTQVQWVAAYRDELMSGSAGALTRNLRDRRYDKAIRAAIADEKPVPMALVDNAVTAYQNRALTFRAEAIGRTEALAGVNAGGREAIRQLDASRKVNPGLVFKQWQSMEDDRVRHTHVDLNGRVIRFDEPFISQRGNRMMHPGDRSLGAGPEDWVNCRCVALYTLDGKRR